ncbi:hypothetical protein B0H13DRAFT_2648518 [Mycena leptocephala]|nr:hypothetical protein B0H13DRAFT_2648518 [Mycena leptocephala]
MSSRRLSLHPSALSDAEYSLFTASLAGFADLDPNDNTGIDWQQISVSVREARAWLCGRYASLGPGIVDEILRLFPAPTLGGGAFFALLRLVLHTQAGSAIDHSLAFVRAPVPAAPIPGANRPSNPFLPTPAPSPEFRQRPMSRSPNNKYNAASESIASTSSSSASASASSGSSAARRIHAYSSSLSIAATNSVTNFNSGSAPPTHPLRRASTQTSSSTSSSVVGQSTASPTPSASSANPNPFRAPPLPPQRASTSASSSTPVSPIRSPANSLLSISNANAEADSPFASNSNSRANHANYATNSRAGASFTSASTPLTPVSPFRSPPGSQYISPANSQFAESNSSANAREADSFASNSNSHASYVRGGGGEAPSTTPPTRSVFSSFVSAGHTSLSSASNAYSEFNANNAYSQEQPGEAEFNATVLPLAPSTASSPFDSSSAYVSYTGRGEDTSSSPFEAPPPPSLRAYPASAGPRAAAFSTQAPPVHPHRLASEFGETYGDPVSPSSSAASTSLLSTSTSTSNSSSRSSATEGRSVRAGSDTGEGRRISSDSATRPQFSNSTISYRPRTASSASFVSNSFTLNTGHNANTNTNNGTGSGGGATFPLPSPSRKH